MRPLRVLLITITLAGCARRVVVDPGSVERLNDRGWTIVREPAPPPR